MAAGPPLSARLEALGDPLSVEVKIPVTVQNGGFEAVVVELVVWTYLAVRLSSRRRRASVITPVNDR
jgi:hypothetical protein